MQLIFQYIQKRISFLGLFLCLVMIAACGSHNSAINVTTPDQEDPLADSDILPSPSANEFDSLASNTFISGGISFTANPEKLILQRTHQNESITDQIVLSNDSSMDLDLTITLTDDNGEFTFLDSNKDTASLLTETIHASESLNLTLLYSAKLVGSHIGLIKITAANQTGMIMIPIKGQTLDSTEVKIISTGYLCSDDSAPALELLDFLRVPSHRSQTMSFKVCNTSKYPVKVYLPTVSSNTGVNRSTIQDWNPAGSFSWILLDALSTNLSSLFRYDNQPQTAEPYQEPTIVTPNVTLPSSTAFFKIKPSIPNAQSFPESGLVIQSQDYAVFDVVFQPALSIVQPSENSLYDNMVLAADIDIKTSLGQFVLDVVGTTGGQETFLELSTISDENPAASQKVNLQSAYASIDFGTADVFTDWVHENSREIQLVFKNTGSGPYPLKIWIDPIESGFFILKPNQDITFPLELEPGERQYVSMLYVPDPTSNVNKVSWDLGQLIIRHNGANGPVHPITLMGQQRLAEAMTVTQNGLTIKASSTDQSGQVKSKNLCAVKLTNTMTEDPTIKVFSIHNNSHYFPIESFVSVSSLTNSEGVPFDTSKVKAILSGSHFYTQSQKSSDIKVTFLIDPALVQKNEEIRGTLLLSNRFVHNLSGIPTTSKIYRIPFKATASETGECKGDAAGAPPTGNVTMIVDRITMNLLGLTEPARNPPPFKFHLPVDFDLDNKSARIHALPYDPTVNKSATEQIRSYAHQFTNVNMCFPLPTNPYKLEFEPGSWDGPTKECSYQSEKDAYVIAEAGVACLNDNGVQEAELTENGETKKVNVFYHEFVNFDDNCQVEMEGKIATFFLREGQTPADVFEIMKKEVGIQGTEDEYAKYTKLYGFDSYILFHKAINLPGCTYPANTTLEGNPDAIKACWQAFQPVDEQFWRVNGMVEECSYFQFDIAEGCFPKDAPEVIQGKVDATKVCKDESITYSDPDTWEGYGTYEPAEDDSLYDLTIRNIHIKAYTLVHSLNGFSGHQGKHLYSDLYVTLTTKVVDNQDLIAVNTRNDFDKNNYLIPYQNNKDADTFWLKETDVNANFTVGTNGDFDDQPCSPGVRHCRGNYYLSPSGQLSHAGEPINLDQGSRGVFVGLAAFHGQGELAPSFAKEDNQGIGKALYFTFHGCVKENEIDENGDPIPFDESVGCYPGQLDDESYKGQDIVDIYQGLGILDSLDVNPDNGYENESKAYINFKIMDKDRNRLTDYYDSNNFYFQQTNDITRACGVGM